MIYTLSTGTSAAAIASLLRVALPDAKTVLDVTYGKGNFWTDKPEHIELHTNDLNPKIQADNNLDFTNMAEIDDNSYDVVVFDPPYHTDVGKRNKSIMHNQFGSYPTIEDLEKAVKLGVQECFRVSRLGIICKVQDYIHGNQAVWMSFWLRDALGIEPYDFMMLHQKNKLMDGKWYRQLSVWRNHTTFWVYRKDSQKHVSRG